MRKQPKLTTAPIDQVIKRLEATGDTRLLAIAMKIKRNIEKRKEQR